MTLFDSYLIVDWSANSVPKRGKDSIWWALRTPDGETLLGNPTTRSEAVESVTHLAATEADLGRRVLIGFDFPFGYPHGTAAALTGEASWEAVWGLLSELIEDRLDNGNNRFDVAEKLNAKFDGVGPFWGRPRTQDNPGVPEKGTAVTGHHPPKRRIVEDHVRSAQLTWKLFTTGSVGSQVLMGLPALQRLRQHPRLKGRCEIWPFETGLAAPAAAVCIAEIYPSLISAQATEFWVKDAEQVRINATAFARCDSDGKLAAMFGGPRDLTPQERDIIEREEAWILGVGFEDTLRMAA